MIVVDTTVLVYFIGEEHPLREPCGRLMGAVDAGAVQATTTVEAIQEFAHVRARRRPRGNAARHGRAFATLLAPLLRPTGQDLVDGLGMFEAHADLGAFNAVLAAVAISRGAEALVSADRAFSAVPGLVHVHPASPELDQLLGG